ncbi:MAG: NAD-dependent epimerase/dehydratase family protein [Rhizobiales bacterium]|nr:NAD-dependent epimerase/dehydratase family protein [Hyphomicrobiales bacterium]
MQQGDLVTVFGGSGFVGRHVVRALARGGYRVRVAVRRPDLAGHLQPMGTPGQIHAVQANVRFPESVARAVAGARAVVNLVAILNERGDQSFQSVHVEGARAVASATRDRGIERLVHISAIGADPASPSDYARSKAEAERAVLDLVPSAIILRPSIVFGPEDDFFNRFAAMARLAPMLPLIGGGKTRFQPVYVVDLALAVARAIGGRAEAGAIYEIGGPEILSFRQLMERVLAYSGRERMLMNVPFWLARLKAAALSLLPNPPITRDQVRLLAVDNVVSADALAQGRTLAGLGIDKPMAIETVVPEYLERFHPKGQFARYRA